MVPALWCAVCGAWRLLRLIELDCQCKPLLPLRTMPVRAARLFLDVLDHHLANLGRCMRVRQDLIDDIGCEARAFMPRLYQRKDRAAADTERRLLHPDIDVAGVA